MTGTRLGEPSRAVIYGTHGVVAAGHYLAAQAGLSVLKAGGNAIDAAVATGLVLHLVEPHQNGLGGEVPILIYSARQQRVWALSGQGSAPQAATIEKFRDLGVTLIPGDGLLPACVPATIGTWVAALRRFGTRSFRELSRPAIELARDGWGVSRELHHAIADCESRFREEWPGSAQIYLSNGRTPRTGEVLTNHPWARTMEQLAAAERAGGLPAVHDCFYRGPVAEELARFSRETVVTDANGLSSAGLLRAEDLRQFKPRWEEPAHTSYRGIEVFKCGPWTQGPVLLQALNLLERFDLAAMGPNSADYLHTVVECMKLAYADREFYYGDPLYSDVPLGRLLSKSYAGQRRRLIDPHRASMQLRAGGFEPIVARSVLDVVRAGGDGPGATHPPIGPADTTKLDIIDREGNMVSATPSGGWISASPVIPSLGFPLGTRGQMFVLDGRHPNGLAPGKRPRTTLTPSLALKDGKPFLSFGSPGGDSQDQWALQFFLNVVEFGMDVQQAVEHPTVTSLHWPNSFYPRQAQPGRIDLEGPIGPKVSDELTARGHLVTTVEALSNGRTHAVGRDASSGLLCAGVSPRYSAVQAIGW